MTPRLMVICLGGLAGAGAVVCCDLDEGAEPAQTLEDQARESPEDPVEAAAEPDASQVH